MERFPYEDVERAKYECLNCGEIVEADSHPGDCPECEGGVQNRAVPLE